MRKGLAERKRKIRIGKEGHRLGTQELLERQGQGVRKKGNRGKITEQMDRNGEMREQQGKQRR